MRKYREGLTEPVTKIVEKKATRVGERSGKRVRGCRELDLVSRLAKKDSAVEKNALQTLVETGLGLGGWRRFSSQSIDATVTTSVERGGHRRVGPPTNAVT